MKTHATPYGFKHLASAPAAILIIWLPFARPITHVLQICLGRSQKSVVPVREFYLTSSHHGTARGQIE